MSVDINLISPNKLKIWLSDEALVSLSLAPLEWKVDLYILRIGKKNLRLICSYCYLGGVSFIKPVENVWGQLTGFSDGLYSKNPIKYILIKISIG